MGPSAATVFSTSCAAPAGVVQSPAMPTILRPERWPRSLHERIEVFAGQRIDRDIGAGLGQDFGYAGADAAAGAGDEGGAARKREFSDHRSPPFHRYRLLNSAAPIHSFRLRCKDIVCSFVSCTMETSFH